METLEEKQFAVGLNATFDLSLVSHEPGAFLALLGIAQHVLQFLIEESRHIELVDEENKKAKSELEAMKMKLVEAAKPLAEIMEMAQVSESAFKGSDVSFASFGGREKADA